jgi:serine/threonine-protein kinase PpkA
MQIPGYRVIRKINQGGMSTVYLAIQISVGRVVALKVMSPALTGDPAFSERFQREATIVGQLSHPHIVAIYDIGKHDNFNYIAMDYLPGGTVHERMMKGLSTSDAVRTTRDIAAALDYAHEKGYIHRDIKPENILFRADHSAVLTDFGVAKGIIGVSRMTNVGQVVGTPHYMSPEQTRGKTLDSRSDLYSLGVVFYEMLTGAVPFQGDEAVAIAIKHISAQVPRLPRQYEQYQKIVDKMLAKDPDQRYQRGRDIIEALNDIESHQKAYGSPTASPTELSTPALLKALLKATTHAIHWRLRRVAQLRWNPQDGFYRLAPASPTLIADNDRQTLIATREQNATELHLLLNSRQRSRLWLLLGAASAILIGGAGLLWLLSGSPTDQILAVPPAVTTTSRAVAEPTAQEATLQESAPQDASPQEAEAGSALSAHPLITAPVSQESAPEVNHLTNFDERATLIPYPPLKSPQPPAAEEVAPPLYSLTVTTTPEDALVRILNIVPRYADGIELAPGRYHIEVSHPEYVTHTTWVTLEDMPLLLGVSLQKAITLPRNFASDLPNGQSGPPMVTIDPGSFTMGSADHPATPAHKVTLKHSFAISRYEITFDEYDLFATVTERALPGDNRWGRGNRPVINVSWEDARAYTQWLSTATGKTYRLPSESEWEYVARAGREKGDWWGEELADAAGKANCRRGCNSRFSGLFGSKTAPVGSYPANALGVSDMAGNVAEWVQDCFREKYQGKPRDGKALNPSQCASRVIRGGSAKDNLHETTDYRREHQPPGIYNEHLGFRVVMELDE